MSEFVVTRAIVINRLPKENNIDITLLTEKLGKIYVKANGAQKITSRRLGQIQLGNIINAHLYRHQNSFWLSESIVESAFLQNQISLSQSNLLFFILEVSNRLLPTEVNQPEIFFTIKQAVDNIKRNSFAKLIDNEIKFLDLLGFGPPEEIILSFDQKKYRHCQQLITAYFESLTNYQFQSLKLW
ncbi:MAG: DNA repair protein RecO [Candidatus Shapirobacteria bacterium]|jgi:DNA repair protein RecO